MLMFMNKTTKAQNASVHRNIVLYIVLTTFLQSCSGYSLMHLDVSDTFQYQELTRRNIVVVDELHVPVLEERQSSSNNTGTTTTSIPSLNTATGLPTPFDTSLGNNFTDTNCPDYFAKFLADETFRSCLPMSLLLQNSMSFFQAARSATLLQRTLDVSCAASLAICSPLMDKFASTLIAAGNCQDDYIRQNPLVTQAYAGLKSYEALYRATCLQDTMTGQYCFLEAMNSSSADDSYPYYTAVGLQQPKGSEPACTSCLKQVMEVFSGYAVQQAQPLSKTYLGCATQVNAGCGADFAKTQIESVSKNASKNSARHVYSNAVGLASLCALSCILMFV